MRPGVLGGLGWLLVLAVFCASALGVLSPRTLRDSWRGPGALNGELTPSLACDLVTDFIEERRPDASVACVGELEVLGDVARLTSVEGDRVTGTYCLARAPMWTVLRMAGAVVPCFPGAPGGERPLVVERQRVDAVVMDRWRSRVAGLQAVLDEKDPPRRCDVPEGARAFTGATPLLDVALVQTSDGLRGWEFLTTGWLRDGLQQGTPEAALVALERWGSGPALVAVVSPSSRQLPSARGPSWSRGQLQGVLTVVDLSRGVALCSRDFEFSSSVVLPPVKPLSRRKGKTIAPIVFPVPTQARVLEDFQAQYRLAATRALNEMTNYRLRAAFN